MSPDSLLHPEHAPGKQRQAAQQIQGQRRPARQWTQRCQGPDQGDRRNQTQGLAQAGLGRGHSDGHPSSACG
jgi:hypothetical protein